jgi:hypothetical protein
MPCKIFIIICSIKTSYNHQPNLAQKKPTIENNDWLFSLLLCLVGTAGSKSLAVAFGVKGLYFYKI